ncbi:uncharacterized protein LOC127757843 [Oryza glaberrima]|uniref:Uncharacterized protein n=2 Tax=Oryza TaxID=4527 RepID=A0A0D3HX43_9ORYZ|nr:uncharacterized protein LOC127757843 [Oryza glaberrima]
MPMRAATSSPRCASFSFNRGGAHAHLGQSCGSRPLGRAAGCLAAAFFASLERCSCVEFPTDDDDDHPPRSRDVVVVSEAAPLLPRATTAAPKKSTSTTTAGKGKISRGGFRCCDNTTTAN